MYPAQTSFIPITVALVKFIESNGFGGLYPFWYLGTTPVKYLIGPVVPLLLGGLHDVLPGFSLFAFSYLAILTSLFLNAIGWGFLASQLSGIGKVGLAVGILVLLLPWRWFSAFGASEVSAVLAQAMTPWVLLAYARIFNFKFSIFNFKWWLPSLAFALLLLTNSTAAIPAVVGIILLSVFGFQLSEKSSSVSQLTGQQKTGEPISENRQQRTDNLQESVKRMVVVITIGVFLATLWYGLDFWLTIWGAPSVGGKSLGGAFVTLLNGLRSILPILLAIVIVYFGTKPKNIYQKFSVLWLTVFISITLIRFMADVDFWMDWASWLGEVEIGGALLIAKNFQFSIFNFHSILKFKFINSLKINAFARPKVANLKFQISKVSILLTLFTIYFFVGWILAWQKRDFWLPRKDISQSVEYRIANWLEAQIRGSTPDRGRTPNVFLSGSTAFWLNSLVDVAQVRGGRDEVSKNANWRVLNWQLTQGENLNDAVRLLKGLGVEYLVVHGYESGEYYHDFVYPQKFGNIAALEKVYGDMGDVIYRIR